MRCLIVVGTVLAVGFAATAQAQNIAFFGRTYSPTSPPSVGPMSPPPTPPMPTYVVPRPGGTVEVYGPNGQHDIAVPNNYPGGGYTYYPNVGR